MPVTTSMTLRSVMVDPYEVRLWNSYGLPNDKVSIENAVLGTRAQRWPLMIDPQEQVRVFVCVLVWCMCAGAVYVCWCGVRMLVRCTCAGAVLVR